MRWKEHPIGDFVTKCQTWNPRSSATGHFSYIDISSVDKATKSIAQVELHECSDAPIRARQLVENDDILVATVRPNLNGVALVSGAHDGMTASTGYCVLRPNRDKLDSKFLFHWVKTGTFVQRMVSVATGANYPAVSDTKVKASKIPLPPLAEQKRIAAILDATDALRAKRREALAELDTLLQSTFLDMFGDPVVNPMVWHVARLENYFSKTRAGTCCGPFGSALKKHEYVEDGIPVWGIDNVQPNQFIQERSLFITSEKFARLRRYSVDPGDILISRAGTVGRMCVALPTVEQSIIGSNLIRLTLSPDAMLPIYFTSLYTFCGERLPGLRTSGDDRAYSFLNTTRLKSLVVPVPPLSLQRRFAAIVQSIEQQRACQRAHLAELDMLFASLQSRAFRGDL